MDTSSRLLAMLNSASSPPGSSTSSPSKPSMPTLSPGGAQAPVSPREPSPFPPPPSLGSLTLQDLFKNIAPSPPPASSPAVTASSPAAAVGSSPGGRGGNEQATKLLGMLRGAGSPPASTGPVTPGIAPGMASGGPSTPFGMSDGSTAKKEEAVKSPPKDSAPVITHPSSPPSQPAAPSKPSTSTATSPKAATSPFADPPSASGGAKKSIFDFVSPFDVFDAPKSKPTPPVTSSTSEAKSRVASVVAPKAAPPAKANGEATGKAPPRAASPSNPIERKPSDPAPPIPAPAASSSGQADRPVSASSSAAPPPATQKGSLDDQLPFTVQKVVGTTKGKGPKSLTGSTTIRLDKPNLEALVSDRDAIQVIPFAKVNTESSEFHHGRTVGLTAGWVAYALHKGRIRLMDRTSGAKLVLQLPSAATAGGIVDIATTPTRVAVIGSNHAVTVWSVPSSWTTDDPPTEELAHISPDSEKIGLPERVEWITRNGEDCLAIGGSGGVVIATVNGHQEFLSQVVASNKVLTTDGGVVSFCINSLGQAIGLLSSTNHLSLYNISTLNRVWHKRIPASDVEAEPSSIQFCESMLLIGRAHDTLFDLVQITVDLCVLSSLSFQIPAPGFSPTHFGRATYDHTHHVLWVSQFARGSLYAFHFNLAGRPPVKVSEGEKAVAWDRMAEYPLDSVSNMVLMADENEGVAMFYATPTNFNRVALAVVNKDAIAALLEGQGSEEKEETSIRQNGAAKEQAQEVAVKTEPTGSKKNKATPASKAAAKVPSPSIPASTLAEEVTVKEEKVTPERKPHFSPAAQVGGDEDLQKALKKMEDRMITQFRQALSQQIGQVNSRVDSLANGALVNDIASKVEKAVKASVTTAVQAEIKKTLPSITSTIQSEMTQLAAAKIPAAVQQSLRDMPNVIEKALGPTIQRGVAVTVMQAMDKTISEAMQRTLIPTITGTVDHTVGTISKEIRSELLQIRKDLSPRDTVPAPSQEPLIRDLMAAVSQLQKQVGDLTTQISRGPSGPTHGLGQMPHGVGQPIPSGPPTAPPLPSPAQLEEVFLNAMSPNSAQTVTGMMQEYGGVVDYILPLAPGARSPLGQALLLTLLHRISLVLAELSPADPTFARAINWERRVAQLLDPHSLDTAQFWGRIIPMVQSGLAGVLQHAGRYSGEPSVQRAMAEVRGVLEILGSKA